MGRARRLVESSSGVIGAGREEIKRFMLRKGTYSNIPVRDGGVVPKVIKLRRVNRSRDGEKSSGAVQDVRRVLGMGGIGNGGLKRLGGKYAERVGEVIGRRRVLRVGVESGERASAKKEVKGKRSALKVEKRSANVIAVRSKRLMRWGSATVNPPLEKPRARPVERYDGIIMLRRRDGMDGKKPVESKPESVVEAEVAAEAEVEKPIEVEAKVEERVVASHPVEEVEVSDKVETAAVFPELGYVEDKVSEEAKGKKKGRKGAKKGRKKTSSAKIVSTEVGGSVVQAVQAALNDASDAAGLAREAAESAAKVNGEDRKA